MSQLRIGRIAQHPLVPDDDRRLLRPHAQLAEQSFRRLVLLEIDEPVRQSIARNELPQPPRFRRESRADNP